MTKISPLQATAQRQRWRRAVDADPLLATENGGDSMKDLFEFGVARRRESAIREHLRKSLRKRCRKYREALKECGKSFSKEPVHELRIETRRLLALIALLRSCIATRWLKRAEQRLTKLFKRLSALRDAQVQIEHFRRKKGMHPEAVPLCDALMRQERRLVSRVSRELENGATRKARRAVRLLSRKANAELAKLPTKELAKKTRHALDEAYGKVAALRQRADSLHPKVIHRTRVAFKKFRYLVELLQPVLTHVSREQLRELQVFQSLMGEIQDIEVFQETIDEFTDSDRGSEGEFRPFCADLEERHAALVSNYAEASARLLSLWRPGRTRTKIALN